MLGARTPHDWMVLFKFGERQFLEELRKRGLLYMKASTKFAELEKDADYASGAKVDPVRADRFEGTDFAYHPKRHPIVIEGPGLDSQGNPQHFRIAEDVADHTRVSLDNLSCNVFCMYATTMPVPVDERNFGFGNSFVFIKNTLEFLRRVSTTANALGLQYEHKLVEYYDLDKHSGPTGPFRKRSEFAFQNEFRLVVRPACNPARRLEIGSIEDITSEVLPLNEINRRFDFSPEAAQKAGLTGQFS
jgi:hypothetical protein